MRTLILLCLSALAAPPQTVEELLWEKLASRLESYDQKMDGVLGVAILDLKTGRRWSYRGDVLFPQASAIKVPILVEMFRLREAGELDFRARVKIERQDVVGGSGVLQKRFGEGQGAIEVEVEEIVREMIASSDNTATNWCIRRAGMENINRTVARLGLPRTRLQRIMIDQAAASRNEENISTPNEMVELVRMIEEGKTVSAKASREMLAMMKLVKAEMREAVPAGVEVASKVGELTGVRTETGIVYLKGRPFVLAVMGTYLTEPFNPVKDVTRLVYEHFEKLAQGNVYGNLGVR
jgi:beta-lactamase class A